MPHFVSAVLALCASLHWSLVPVYFVSHHVTLAVDQALPTAAAASDASAPPTECQADQRLGTFRLPNVTCYSTFTAPDGGMQLGAVSNPRQLTPPTLLLVSILAPVGTSSSDALCGLDRPGQSGGTQPSAFLSRARSTSAGALEVRRGVDRRWLLTSSFIDPQWYTVMAWTNASLHVLFDQSCSNSSGQRFVQQYIPSWSICRRFANGSSVQFESWNNSTLFAQDRRLTPWLTLPGDYECSDGKDYELIVSASNASTKLTVTLYTRPGNESCRMLCIAEQCDGNFYSDHLVSPNRSLAIRYVVRSTASKCDVGAYTGFALVLQVNPARVITLTTYELDSPFNALESSSTSDSHLIIACVVGAVSLVIIVVASIVIARWRALRSRRVLVGCRTSEPNSLKVSWSSNKIQNESPLATLQNDGSLEASWHAAQTNQTRANASPKETGQNDKVLNTYGNVTKSGPKPSAAASSAQLLDRATEVATHDIDDDEIYAEIDDFGLSTQVPRNATCTGPTAGDVDGVRFVGSHSLGESHLSEERARKPKSDKYTTLDGPIDPIDEHPYSVPL